MFFFLTFFYLKKKIFASNLNFVYKTNFFFRKKNFEFFYLQYDDCVFEKKKKILKHFVMDWDHLTRLKETMHHTEREMQLLSYCFFHCSPVTLSRYNERRNLN